MPTPRSAPAPFHLVLGAGQVGDKVARLLAEQGLPVRVARRSAAPSRVPGVTTVQLDVRDAEAVARAAEGAAAVYHCANPAYHKWGEELLPLTTGIAEGASRAGAALVMLDNLYMYGDTASTARMDERTAPSPRSKKGRLRQQAADAVQALYDRRGLRLAIGRAADFFGPETPTTGVLGDRFFTRLLAGKPVEFVGSADHPHTYSYTPDVARALVALGTTDSARGLYMLPAQPAETTRAVFDRFARAVGKPLRTTRVPAFVLRIGGLFVPEMAEVIEMTYQWQQPFILDDTKIRAELGQEPTPWDEAIAATLEWARRAYGR